MILGDRIDGSVQLDMVAMIDAREDTVILRDLLKESGLPEMRNAIYVCHTAASNAKTLWVMSETGSYYLDGSSMTGSPESTFNTIFYTSLNVSPDAKPILRFPPIAAGREYGIINGMYRGYLLSDGSIVWSGVMDGEYYGNPVNRIAANPNHLIDVFPYVFGCIGSMKSLAAYDRENERFIGCRGVDAMMSTLSDNPGDVFPWNQGNTGRTLIHGDNTKNTLGGAQFGRSYALMKDRSSDYFIYAFYVEDYFTYSKPSSKKGFWKIKKELVPQIDNAEYFLFSSSRPLLYYVVNDKVYCYNYEVGAEECKIVADYHSDEITWIGVDYWTETDFSRILVSTWNKTTGGTLRKYSESKDQNLLDWKEEKESVWGGFPKIKSVSWRNSAY